MEENKTFFEEKFIARWVSGKITAAEKNEFEKWINNNLEHKAYFDQIKNIWDNTGKLEFTAGKSEEERWQRISEKLDINESNTFTLHFYKIASVAAIFIFAIVIYFWQFNQSQIEEITTMAKHQVVYLPDSSKITLNAESKIRYDENEWHKIRQIVLEGEAFFEVKPGRQFNVKSNNVTTTVLGTSFNIYSRDNKTEVACITGKVSVSGTNNDLSAVILTPGFASGVLRDSNPSHPFRINTYHKIGWISGEFYFESKPVREVLEEIERQNGYPIVLHKYLDQQLFTGMIKGTDIEKALEVVCLSSGLNYSFDADSTILIY